MPELVHADAALTDVAISRGPNVFISNDVFMPKGVAKQSDLIPEVDREGEAERAHDDVRAPGTIGNTGDFRFRFDDSYICRDHAFSAPVTDEERGNVDVAVAAFIEKTRFCADVIRRNKEIDAVAKIAAVMTGGLTSSPGTKWDNYTSGDPIGDIIAKISAVELASGIAPNALAMDIATYRLIANHPSVQGVSAQTVNPQDRDLYAHARTILSLTGLDAIAIAQIAIRNTAAKGAARTPARIWADNVLLYRKEQIGIGTNAFGATFEWESAPIRGGMVVERFRHPDARAKADIVAASYYYDQKVFRSLDPTGICGHWFTNTMSAF